MAGDIARLPLWARALIERLEKDLATARRDHAAAFGVSSTPIEVDRSLRSHPSSRLPRLYLPIDSRIYFTLDRSDGRDRFTRYPHVVAETAEAKKP